MVSQKTKTEVKLVRKFVSLYVKANLHDKASAVIVRVIENQGSWNDAMTIIDAFPTFEASLRRMPRFEKKLVDLSSSMPLNPIGGQ